MTEEEFWNLYFSVVEMKVEGDAVYFGDIAELHEGCSNDRGLKISMEKGEYIVLYGPGIFLMVNKKLTFEDLRKFFELMFPDGWFDDYNLKFHLPIESYGRLGHCVTTYDGTYAICDASIPMKEIKKIKEPPKLTRKEPAVSSFDGRGAFTIVDTEYRYAFSAGKQLIMSTGDGFPCLKYQKVVEQLEKIWCFDGFYIKGDEGVVGEGEGEGEGGGEVNEKDGEMNEKDGGVEDGGVNQKEEDGEMEKKEEDGEVEKKDGEVNEKDRKVEKKEGEVEDGGVNQKEDAGEMEKKEEEDGEMEKKEEDGEIEKKEGEDEGGVNGRKCKRKREVVEEGGGKRRKKGENGDGKEIGRNENKGEMERKEGVEKEEKMEKENEENESRAQNV